MSSQTPTVVVSTPDPTLTVLERWALATRVLGERTNDCDLCTVCGSAWPCERVVLADHNLAVL
ncbi:MAG: hypothetical protein M3548_19985 [Actinomycetota bacterium]|nr:hypothetical protein [Actinomycetota bacterium]